MLRRAIDANSELQSACYVTGVMFCHENPVVSVSKMDHERNTNAWNVLNLSHNYCLSSLNDESLLSAVFEGSGVADTGLIGTNYKFGRS